MQSTHPRSDALRTLVDWLDERPDFAVYSVDLHTGKAGVVVHYYSAHDAKTLADTARELGGQWAKVDNGNLFTLRQTVVPGVTVELSVMREQVCELVETGTREVEIEEPDPDALAALPKVKRTVTEPVREWRCPHSLLAVTAQDER